MKDKKSARQGGACRSAAFTLVELLTVVGIIAILVALLIPALTTVRKMAKETQQRAQITAIEMALTAFKNDYGEYPPSHGWSAATGYDYSYCGAQTLAEALVGWDLMGFHPNSAWKANGKDKDGVNMVYLDGTETPDEKEANLKARRGPYLELATANTFRLGDLFTNASVVAALGSDAPRTFVICDVFGRKSVTIGGKTVRAGSPILYYRANTSSKTIDDSEPEKSKRIYNRDDNYYFVGNLANVSPLANDMTQHPNFYDYITDPKVTTPTIKWPYRPDSYILISAGADGLYGDPNKSGTGDDICNF